MPLFIALLFHGVAALILAEVWGVKSKLTRLVVVAFSVSCPSIAYMYTFSTLNFGAGIAFFLTALSLFLHSRCRQRNRFWAIIPGICAISIYQGFAVALFSAFLIHLISLSVRQKQRSLDRKEFQDAAITLLLSGIGYYVTQKIFFIGMNLTLSSYITGFFRV